MSGASGCSIQSTSSVPAEAGDIGYNSHGTPRLFAMHSHTGFDDRASDFELRHRLASFHSD
ncbi:hypothetical protein BQ8482_30032 [Mesorhizobium delmotii]|uniref:Uncharacterized protein n=1 Tax=Mesorhizobium delmotii TaxID=1631247 RepID=A0A2P9AN45_9HYPH|nr:hypothetical protein BQ8482_30032 [Mesorhizobium delmotii]